MYLAAVFRALSSLSCPHFRITTAEGRTIEDDMLIVSIGNGNRTGGAFYLTPDALPDDGLIDVKDIDAAMVTSFVYSLYGGCRKVTVARKLSSIRSFFRFLVKKGFSPVL